MSLVFSGYILYKNATKATEEALKMQALGITLTMNSLIQNSDIEKLKYEGSRIMSEILLDEKWQGVAFMALYDINGNVVIHSNPALMGQRFEEVKKFFSKDTPCYHKVLLGTGEEVFVSDTKITIKENPFILRVALHIYPAEYLFRASKVYLIFIFLSAFVILFGGILTVFIMGKIEKMQIKIKELENISVVSKVLAHEIRNPLGSIKGFAQYLLKKDRETESRQYLDIIVKESLRIERLIEELSQYAHPKNISKKEINLKEFIKEVTLPFINQNNSIKFILETEDIQIKTDSDKLRRILNNIIQNSVDAVQETQEKKITVKAGKSNDKIKIEVKDTGIGMDEEIFKRAIEHFFTTKAKGTGLGLAIVKRLCEILKIDLQIKSKKNEGTTVCLNLTEFS